MDIKQIISRVDINGNIFCVAQGNSNQFKITLTCKQHKQYCYSIYHNNKYKTSLIFDLEWSKRHNYFRENLVLPSELKKGLLKKDIYCLYRKTGNSVNKFYEKILLIPDEYISEILQRIDEYMLFNEYDDGFPSQLKNDTQTKWANPEIRKRESITRWKRNHDFREYVLNRYNRKCAICRCDIVEILEAAHLEGHNVANGKADDDNPIYGICLCRNHHKLYDCHFFKIDMQSQTLQFNDSNIKANNSFTDFFEKYNGKILAPNNQTIQEGNING
jgi:hypothetical protein